MAIPWSAGKPLRVWILLSLTHIHAIKFVIMQVVLTQVEDLLTISTQEGTKHGGQRYTNLQ